MVVIYNSTRPICVLSLLCSCLWCRKCVCFVLYIYNIANWCVVCTLGRCGPWWATLRAFKYS